MSKITQEHAMATKELVSHLGALLFLSGVANGIFLALGTMWVFAGIIVFAALTFIFLGSIGTLHTFIREQDNGQ